MMIKTVVKIWNTKLKYGNIIIPFHSGIAQDILFNSLKLVLELKPYSFLDHGYGIS